MSEASEYMRKLDYPAPSTLGKMTKDLLKERDELLEALEVAYNYPQVGGAYQPWMEKAKVAIAKAKGE